MKINIVDVDPAQARQWMALNRGNRKLRKSVVQTYALDMIEGRWRATGDTIKLNGDRLLDGQHRLAAIIESGATLPMAIATEVDAAAMDAVDIGAARFTRDILEMRGVANASTVASIARLAASWEHGVRWGLGSGSWSRVALADRVDERIIASASRAAGGGTIASAISPRVLGFCHWLFTGQNRERGETFIDRLIDGTDTQSAIHILRERLLRERLEAQPARRPTAAYLVAVIIMGWNAWRRGEQVSKIQLPKGQEFPEPR